MPDLPAQFGNIDIYVFDQLLRGRIAPPMRVLDAGCGSGRNLLYLMQSGFDVFGIDADPAAIATVRQLAARLAPQISPDNFRIEQVERTTFPTAFADVVLSNALLHFAKDDAHFDAMLHELWRVLKPGGVLFCRLASLIGMEDQVLHIEGRHYLLPDGTQRYLVDEAQLMRAALEMGGELLDPLKTTIVQNQRSMTTWVLSKPQSGNRTSLTSDPAPLASKCSRNGTAKNDFGTQVEQYDPAAAAVSDGDLCDPFKQYAGGLSNGEEHWEGISRGLCRRSNAVRDSIG